MNPQEEYIEITKKMLKSVSAYKERISFLDKTIQRASMNGCPRDLSGMDYTGVHGTGLQDDAMTAALYVISLKTERSNLQDHVDKIMDAVQSVGGRYGDYIRLHYICGYTIEQTSEMLTPPVSDRQARRIQNIALLRFYKVYFGRFEDS